MPISYDSLFIGGGWVPPSSAARIEVISSSTEAPIGSVPEAQEADVDAAVAAARRAFDERGGWADWDPARRGAALESLAVALEGRAEEMAKRVSMQNGMPIAVSGLLEGAFPVMVIRYIGGLLDGATFEEERPAVLGGTNIVRREPIGVAAGIVPWNYPQTLAAFKYAPALAAGCTIVLKPSPETVLDAFLFAEAVAESGLPPGVINIVPGGREIGAYLVEHRDVDKVAFRRRPGPGQDRQRPVRGHAGQQRADLLPRHPGAGSSLAIRRGRRHHGRVRLVAGRGQRAGPRDADRAESRPAASAASSAPTRSPPTSRSSRSIRSRATRQPGAALIAPGRRARSAERAGWPGRTRWPRRPWGARWPSVVLAARAVGLVPPPGGRGQRRVLGQLRVLVGVQERSRARGVGLWAWRLRGQPGLFAGQPGCVLAKLGPLLGLDRGLLGLVCLFACLFGGALQLGGALMRPGQFVLVGPLLGHFGRFLGQARPFLGPVGGFLGPVRAFPGLAGGFLGPVGRFLGAEGG